MVRRRGTGTGSASARALLASFLVLLAMVAASVRPQLLVPYRACVVVAGGAKQTEARAHRRGQAPEVARAPRVRPDEGHRARLPVSDDPSTWTLDRPTARAWRAAVRDALLTRAPATAREPATKRRSELMVFLI